MKTKYVICEETQRKRLLQAETKEVLDRLAFRVKTLWHYEAERFGISHKTYNWRKRHREEEPDLVFEDALKKLVKFPALPKPSTEIEYQSVFIPPVFGNGDSHQAFLSEYEAFFGFTETHNEHRLDTFLKAKHDYPAPQPSKRAFPDIDTSFSFKKLDNPSSIPVKPNRPEFPNEPLFVRQKTEVTDYILFWRRLKKIILDIRNHRLRMAAYSKQLSEWKTADALLKAWKLKWLDQQKIHDQEKKTAKTVNDWLQQLKEDRECFYQSKMELYDNSFNEALRQWELAKSNWHEAYEKDKADLKVLQVGYEQGNDQKTVERVKAFLNSIPLPHWCPRNYEISFDAEAQILLIECELPYFPDLEILKVRELAYRDKNVNATQKEAREFTNKFPYLLALRFMWEIPRIDPMKRFGMICCNGLVNYDDPATGRKRRDIILSVSAMADEIKDINLSKVDPEACFRKLKGVSGSRISDLIAVQPLLRFDKNDDRFVDSKAVLDQVGDENLAAMDWQDFEYLIRELFEKEFSSEGAEVKVTQASRDRGVDAIAFDPDPIRGGKFVIQAKRYTNLVGVSAVRDLFGTIVNEGANTGILVTTSNYGKDAYDFVKDKPLTLINGAELLHMLKKHGYNLKIDLKEARKLLEKNLNGDNY